MGTRRGNPGSKLVAVMENGTWALKDTEEAKRLRADAAVHLPETPGTSSIGG